MFKLALFLYLWQNYSAARNITFDQFLYFLKHLSSIDTHVLHNLTYGVYETVLEPLVFYTSQIKV